MVTPYLQSGTIAVYWAQYTVPREQYTAPAEYIRSILLMVVIQGKFS